MARTILNGQIARLGAIAVASLASQLGTAHTIEASDMQREPTPLAPVWLSNRFAAQITSLTEKDDQLLAISNRTEVHHSSDDGKTWTLLPIGTHTTETPWIANPLMHQCALTDDGAYLLATSDGLYTSSDEGKHWELTISTNPSTFEDVLNWYSFDQNFRLFSNIYRPDERMPCSVATTGDFSAFVNDGEVHVLIDNAWEHQHHISELDLVSVAAAANNSMLAISRAGELHRLTLANQTLKTERLGKAAIFWVEFALPVLREDDNGNIYVGSTRGLHISKDTGKTYELVPQTEDRWVHGVEALGDGGVIAISRNNNHTQADEAPTQIHIRDGEIWTTHMSDGQLSTLANVQAEEETVWLGGGELARIQIDQKNYTKINSTSAIPTGRELLRSVSVLDDPPVRYFVIIIARDGRLGHAFVSWGMEDQQGQRSVEQGFGLYPKKGLGVFSTVPGVLKDEWKEKSYSRMTNRLVVEVDKEAYDATLKIRDEWAARGEYKVIENDCVEFTKAVAQELGLPIPKRSWTKNAKPARFVQELMQAVSTPGVSIGNKGNLLTDTRLARGNGYEMGVDNSTYSGEVLDREWHGEGRFTSRNNNTIEGTWQKGAPQEGTLTLDNGSRFEGTFDGWGLHEGRFENLNGTVIEGQFNGWEPSKGTFTMVDGTRFEGTFQKWEGHRGKITFPDGSTFEGTFEPGWNRSDGKIKLKNGATFEGKFKNDIPSEGKYQSPNGDTFEGKFREDGSMQEGKYTWKNGAWYRGSIKDGQPHGRGRYVSANGRWDLKGEFTKGTYENGTTVVPITRRPNRHKKPPIKGTITQGTQKIIIEDFSTRR